MKDVAATIIAVCAACGSDGKEPAMDPNGELPIACVLSALTAEQRARESVLLEEHRRSVREVEEHDDGYSFRYDPDMGLFGRMAELVALEHRCCPFLDFQLQWGRAASDPWLHVRGGARVKSFVRDAFTAKPEDV
jgi:hypothetical protein